MTAIIAIVEGVEETLLRRNIKRLNLHWWDQAFQNKHYAQLDCGPVPYEPSNLMTAFTGMSPGHHGCYSYWDIHSNVDGKPRVLNAQDVKAPLLWHLPEFKDKRVAVVNIQLTHPPQKVNGYLISYLMNQSLRATYPEILQQE